MCLIADKYTRREYPTPDMASILKATFTVGARPLKPIFSKAREVRGKLEHLSKEHTSKGLLRRRPLKKTRVGRPEARRRPLTNLRKREICARE